jgi:hypothetical protein
MPQTHPAAWLGYGSMISLTGVACLCSTATPAPQGSSCALLGAIRKTCLLPLQQRTQSYIRLLRLQFTIAIEFGKKPPRTAKRRWHTD